MTQAAINIPRDEITLDRILSDTISGLDIIADTDEEHAGGPKYYRNLLRKIRQECAGVLNFPFSKGDEESVAQPFAEFFDEVQELARQIDPDTGKILERELVRIVPHARMRQMVEETRLKVMEAHSKYQPTA